MNMYLEFDDDLNAIPTKDIQEIKKFGLVNLVFAFIRTDDKNRYYLHFITANKYQFALSTQKRSDRPYQIRKFASLESALTTAMKCNIVSVARLSGSANIGLAKSHLFISKI